MILETGNSEGGYIIERARRALACGLSAQWVLIDITSFLIVFLSYTTSELFYMFTIF